jgi:predicted TIM-barrel enzyme
VFVGSGVSAESVSAYRQADGFIVGTSLKEGGRVSAPVDARRVRTLADAIAALRNVS